jgi:hypothetical protein
MKKVGKRALNMLLPSDLYISFSKLCIDLGISKTEGIIRCLKRVEKDKTILEKEKCK